MDTGFSSSAAADEEALNELTAQLSNFNWKEGVVDHAKRNLYSTSVEDNIKGVLSLKAMLCIGREEVYEVAQEVIDSGVIARLVEFLAIDLHQDLQLASAFCLTNVAAGLDDQTSTVVEAGALEPLVRLLRHETPQLRRQAIFCLANVAGSTSTYRQMLARHPDYFPALFDAVNKTADPKIIELVCWNLRNVSLLGGPSFGEVKNVVVFFIERIINRCWMLPNLSSSVQFAVETVSNAAKSAEGRELLLNDTNAPELLITLVERSSASLIANFATEALAWLLAFGHNNSVRDLMLSTGMLTGFFLTVGSGGVAPVGKELAAKCLVCFAATASPDQLARFLEAEDGVAMERSYDLLTILTAMDTGQHGLKFSGLEGLTPSSVGTPGQPSIDLTSMREMAGFVFCKLLLSVQNNDLLLIKVLTNLGIVPFLIDLIEFEANESRLKSPMLGSDRSAEDSSQILTTTSGLGISMHPDPNVKGPVFSKLSQAVASLAINVLLVHLRRGTEVHVQQGLPQNPVHEAFLSSDGPSRLQHLLSVSPLPPEAYQAGTEILQEFLLPTT